MMTAKDIESIFRKYSSSYIFKLSFIFVIYVALGELTFLMHDRLGIKGQIWPAGGAALAFVFIWGYSIWPAIFFAAIVLQAIHGYFIIPLSAQAIANTAEPILAAYYCLRSASFDNSLNRLQDVFRGFAAAIFSGFSGAIIGIAGVYFSGVQNIDLYYFIRYWAGHSLGLVMLTPLLLVFSTPNPLRNFEWEGLKKGETIFFVAAFSGSVFLTLLYSELFWFFLFFPVVLWSALRFGQRGSMLTVFFLGMVAIYRAAPWSAESNGFVTGVNEVYLTVFVVTLQLTGLIAGAFVLERETERVNKEKAMMLSNSELEKTMIALRKAKEAAESSSSAKTAFLANVSHEIRTPLGAVLGFSELILTNGVSENERKKIYEIIKRNGMQLLNVINDILDLSKIEAGKFELQKRAVAVDEVMEDIKLTMGREADKKGLSLKFIREINAPKKIYTDPLRLRQILINIIGNAIKFTDRGSVDLVVKAVVDKDGETKTAFIVTDTGVGIPADKVKDLFLPFTQVDVSSTRRFGGTGLGLALSRRLAKALGGEISLVKTTLGQGSEFVVTIDPGDTVRIADNEKKMQVQSNTQLQKIISSKGLANKVVLLVEDNSDNQNLFTYYIKSVGAKVELANNGVEALKKIHTGQYDIVLMDLQMPEMDGYEATKVLRKEGYKKPIVALSAHAMKEVRERCLANGFDGYISKPVERLALIEVLVEFLNKKQQEVEIKSETKPAEKSTGLQS